MKMLAGLALTNLCAVALAAQTTQTSPAPVTPTSPMSSSPTPSLPTTTGTPTTEIAPSTPAATAGTAAAAPAPATPELTKKEQSTLTRCMRLTPQEQAQSSKCGEVMAKAGKGDPAKARQTTPNVIEE